MLVLGIFSSSIYRPWKKPQLVSKLLRLTTIIIQRLYPYATVRNPRPDRPKIWEIWNTHLGEKASGFASEHPDLTVFKFSAHQLFSQVLDNPVQYGFAQGDEKKAYGPIWHDHLHPTSRMHYEIARGFMDFIEAQHSTYNGDHENKTPEYT